MAQATVRRPNEAALLHGPEHPLCPRHGNRKPSMECGCRDAPLSTREGDRFLEQWIFEQRIGSRAIRMHDAGDESGSNKILGVFA